MEEVAWWQPTSHDQQNTIYLNMDAPFLSDTFAHRIN